MKTAIDLNPSFQYGGDLHANALTVRFIEMIVLIPVICLKLQIIYQFWQEASPNWTEQI